MIMAAFAEVVAAVFIVLVFISAALQPAQDDKENPCCENEGEDDKCFHDRIIVWQDGNRDETTCRVRGGVWV